ncbi:MAG TPA: Gfo/Idh/MocA family oxidoreductase [Gaiella sp.]|uniref:Gfo/Idh/MocA family protein n=1 Tax=Gaiella sp. TaxID=2663207 RepID=UPI002D7EA473|nr:Gfo/Idh/MocA family oxidoreductase [Gaiella sp.]HET9288359.1 Gfo/Idh/MocA family oxidoreductase [Gaiella sp.]
MSSPARVGLIGCGVISHEYVENAAAFDRFEIVACSDQDSVRSEALAREHGLEATTTDELLRCAEIDIVLNLTPPVVHAAVTGAALEAGKHVYSEKPLAMSVGDATALLALADARGLRIACAPDIFLGGALQEARALVDGGAIGRPLAVSATMLAGGQEAWHPDPDIFFRDGAGPLLDMGPYYLTAIVSLLGPVARVAGLSSTLVHERTIEVGPRRGERFPAETPTHTTAAMELDGGVTATLIATFEAPHHYSSTFLVLGSEGTLSLPDPNSFGEPVRARHGRGDWHEVPYRSRGAREARGIGLHDLVGAISARREPRASGRLALHVIDVARSILRSAEAGETLAVASTVARPEPLPVEEAIVVRPPA